MTETELPSLQSGSQERRVPTSVWVCAAVFAILSAICAWTSEGFLEADACTHFLSASFGFKQPFRLVSVWDRPLFMLLYTPAAAWGGVFAARLVSLVMALTCAWCAWRIATKLQIRKPELAFIFTLGQPLLFLHSFAEMTELCFAAVIGMAFLAFLHRQYFWMALLVAISPLGRPEGFGFLLLAAGTLVLYRKWLWLLVLPMPLLLWSLCGWILWGMPDYNLGPASFLLWLPKVWPYSGTSAYEAGPLLLWKTQSTGLQTSSFLIRLPMLLGPLLFPFVIYGTITLLRGIRTWREQPALGRLLCVALSWGVLAGHSFLWWRGLMASNGELRYLLVTAPLWAVVGAAGMSALIPSLTLGRNAISISAVAGVLAILPAFANLHFKLVPLPLYDDDHLSRQVADWYSSNPDIRSKYPRLSASYIAVYLHLQYSPTDSKRTVIWSKSVVKQRPKGVVLVWDEINGTKNADAEMCVTLEELEKNGWREIHRFQRGDRVWKAFVANGAGSD